jgi:hypothetical protein
LKECFYILDRRWGDTIKGREVNIKIECNRRCKRRERVEMGAFTDGGGPVEIRLDIIVTHLLDTSTKHVNNVAA